MVILLNAFCAAGRACLTRAVYVGLVALAGLVFSQPALSQLTVSAGGAPGYEYPIAVPPGIAGIQPSLSVAYSGGGVNGPVGHGWSVQGVSVITRCPSSRRLDALARDVSFDGSDRLCLDGQRLIQTNESGVALPFPQTGDALGLISGWREYRTEKDTFVRVRAYGATAGVAANGPLFFRVWTKSGQIYDYGAAPSADGNTKAAIVAQGKTAVAVWATARVSDLFGNYMDFKYEVRPALSWGSGAGTSPAPGLEWNLAEVQYTGNTTAGQASSSKVVFRYSDRTQMRSEAYHAGSKNISVRRLDAIETYVKSANPGALGPAAGSVLVRRLQLRYDTGRSSRRLRLISLSECQDTAARICQPPTVFSYSDGAAVDSFSGVEAFDRSPLATTNLTDPLTGDFNGDGRTDILRWSNNSSENRLYLSNGDGTFAEVPLGSGPGRFDLTDINFFYRRYDSIENRPECFLSIAADFNGDGLTDVLRQSSSSCGLTNTAGSVLLISQGDGSFRRITTLPPLARSQSTSFTCYSPYVSCVAGGHNFFVGDFNGDALLDFVTVRAAFAGYLSQTSSTLTCLSGPGTCETAFYAGQPGGTFSAKVVLESGPITLYRPPSEYLSQVLDVNGDGLADLDIGSTAGRGGVFINNLSTLGAPVFSAASGSLPNCYNSIAKTWWIGSLFDVNGDGKSDYLCAQQSVSSNRVSIATGNPDSMFVATQVSGGNGTTVLNGSGDELVDSPSMAGVIHATADFTGDGLSDILRIAKDPTLNVLFVSNGNGSFTKTGMLKFNGAAEELFRATPGFAPAKSFVLGDFLGDGTVQILRTSVDAATGQTSADRNRLFARGSNAQPDLLTAVVSSAGLRTAVTYASLANSQGRYLSDRGTANAAITPVLDLTPARPVVVTLEAETGVKSSKVLTEYAYQGLKAALDGRGELGFRRIVQQVQAPNGQTLSTWTEFLQIEPYSGVPSRAETRLGAWNQPDAQLLNWSTYVYCDRTSSTTPRSAAVAVGAPCPTTAKIRRPYLYMTTEGGFDIDGNRTALPTTTTTNTYNDYGDPVSVSVVTQSSVAGLSAQRYTRLTVSDFCAPDSAGCPNKIAGDNWLLGRMLSTTVTSSVPNLMPNLGVSAGDAPNATAISGVAPPALSLNSCSAISPSVTPTPATMTCSVSNTGGSAIASISYAGPVGTTVSGFSGSCLPGSTCGVVTVTSGTAVGSYTGTLVATPNAGSSASQPVSLAVSNPPATLAFSGCSSTTPTITPTAATLTCSIRNTGGTGVSSIAYTTASGTTVNGPTGACGAGAACGTVTVTSGSAAGTYTGTLTATSNSGVVATQAVALIVNQTAAALRISACTSNSPVNAPSSASMSCTLSNTGGTTISTISYTTAPGTTVTGPNGTCWGNTTCGTVTVQTNNTASSYSGTVTATPNTGTAASQAVSLVVNPPPAPLLVFSNCTRVTPTKTPTPASLSCTLANTGSAATTSISYSSPANTTVVGPSGACAAAATCGTVTLTTSSAAGTYFGALVATPSTGSPANWVVDLKVDPLTPATLSFEGCAFTGTAITPVLPSANCVMRNVGDVPASAISYSFAPAYGGQSSPSMVGPSTCAANSACGTVSVSAVSGSRVLGTLSATPSSGSAGSAFVNLIQTVPAALSFSACSSTSPATTPTAARLTCTLTNTGGSDVTSIAYSVPAGTSVVGPTGSCTAGASCGSVTVTSGTAVGTYSGTLSATPNTGTGATQTINLSVVTPPALELSSCAANSPTISPTPATLTCTLSNTGGAAATSVSYTQPAGTTVSGPTGACAAGANCGTVTVSSANAAGSYGGTLTATPSGGSPASRVFSLQVNPAPAALQFSGCSSTSPTITPTAAGMTCTLSNVGGSGVTSVSYSTAAGTTVSGPTGACAAGATCGPVTVTSGATAGTYSGTLIATPSAGSSVSRPISLTVNNTPPALTLSACTRVSPTFSPTPATMTCSLANVGGTAVASVSYNVPSNSTVRGPAGACAAGATCGTVTVTTGTAAASYGGTLTVTPNVGTGASQAIDLTVNVPTPASLNLNGCAFTASAVTPNLPTAACMLANSGGTAAASITYGFAPVYSGQTTSSITGPQSCPAGAECGLVTLTAQTSAQVLGSLDIRPSGGTTAQAAQGFVRLTSIAPATLSFAGCTTNSPTVTPNAATLQCTLMNVGGLDASTVSYSSPTGTTVNGPTGACGAGVTCGTVTVTTQTAAGTYAGTLVAAPASGTAATQAVTLVVNSLPALSISACTSNSPSTSPNPATLSCLVRNVGGAAVSSIAYSAPAGTGVSGPTGACASGADCGTVTVTSGTAVGTYSGSVQATPDLGTPASQSFSLAVNAAPPALVLSACSSTTPTSSPVAASMRCTVSNAGGTAAASISYSTATGTSATGPTGACEAGSTCGTATVTTSPSAGTYVGSLVATPSAGAAASQAYNLVVDPATPASLSFNGCSFGGSAIAPSLPSASCTLVNTGGTDIGYISYSFAPNFGGQTSPNVSGPTACAGLSTCGTVTLTAASSGPVLGTLSATPNTGSTAQGFVNLSTTQPATLAFSACSSSSPAVTPTAATLTCTLSNVGGNPANSISYSTAPGTSVSGPTGACAAGATCGTVTVATSTAVGAYSGTLTASPSSGNSASQAVNLVVTTPPPVLSLNGCTSVTPTTAPTPATMSCTLSNSGGSGVSSISYSAPIGTTVSGPTGACGAGSVCGTVVVTTASAAGSYSGTLTATPNTGNAVSQGVNLLVNAPAFGTFTRTGGSSPGGSGSGGTGVGTITIQNTGSGTITGISFNLVNIGIAGCVPTSSAPASLAPGESMTLSWYKASIASVACTPRVSGTNATNSPASWPM